MEETIEEPIDRTLVREVSEYEGNVFSEPDFGFKCRDTMNQDVVHLPGLEKVGKAMLKIKKEDSARKIKKEDSARKIKKEDSARKIKKEDSASKIKKEDSSRKMKKEDSARKIKKEDSARKIKKENSARILKKETSATKLEKDDRRVQKKKVSRQPANVYQATHEFKKDFQPPKFPKTDDEKEIIKKALRKNFVFADLTSKELKPLISAFELCNFEVDEIIIKQGDMGDYFYIIKRGKVVFQVNGVDVGKAGKGSSFGELALLYACPRAATVVAAKTTTVFRLDEATFQFILHCQIANSAKEKLELLKGVNFLKDLDKQHLKLLTRQMTPKIFSEGDVLVRKGDPGDAFYVIQEGRVMVKDISVGGTTYPDLELGPGAYFGERALVTSEPRAANVVGKAGGVAFFVNRSTFEKALGGMENAVMKAQDARLLSGIAVFHRACFSEDMFVRLADLVTESCYVKSHVILEAGAETSAAMYIVREGEILVTSRGQANKIYSAGEYVGVEAMVEAAESGNPKIKVMSSVLALTACSIGILTLTDCRYVFDTKLLTGKQRAPSYTLTKEELRDLPLALKRNINFETLKKETIIGAGTFGKVWLVCGTDEDTGETQPYALKIQPKYTLYKQGQVNAAICEKQLLLELKHPFIVELITTHQDQVFVYILTEFVQGGELFSRLHNEDGSGMDEDEAKFYAIGITDAFAYLHSMMIVYRDLKPENVLIDTSGYPMLIDFGFAKYCPEKTYTFCGTPGYVCPEIITKRGHDCSADNWSLGVLLYEMLSGDNPFYFDGMDQMTLFRCIVEDDFLPLTNVSKEASEIVSALLVKDPSKRLGSSRRCGFVLQHAWFDDIDLEAMRQRKLEPPWKPKLADPYDAANFDDWDNLVETTPEEFPPIPEEVEEKFQEEF